MDAGHHGQVWHSPVVTRGLGPTMASPVDLVHRIGLRSKVSWSSVEDILSVSLTLSRVLLPRTWLPPRQRVYGRQRVVVAYRLVLVRYGAHCDVSRRLR